MREKETTFFTEKIKDVGCLGRNFLCKTFSIFKKISILYIAI